MRDIFIKLRYRFWPDHVIGELLSKSWTETVVPIFFLLITVVFLSFYIDNFISVSNVIDTIRASGELGFVVLAMALVLMGGGIDLSVGSMFALCTLCALYVTQAMALPVPAAIAVTLVVGGMLGMVNGVLIGYFRLRAFLTTLITLIIYRSLFDMLSLKYAVHIASSTWQSDTWDWIGSGDLWSIPVQGLVFALVAIFGHIFLTRLRSGWHVGAIGGSRRAAYNAGIKVKRVIAMTYVASGVLTACGSVFFAARLASAGADTGRGMEVTVLTAAVLGGIRLGGGRGSVTKAVLGLLIVILITDGLLRMAVPGGPSRVVLGCILLLAAIIDIRWHKNRGKLIQEVYVSPTYLQLPSAPSSVADSGTAYAVNDRLHNVMSIGVGEVESPEDVILDNNDDLYCGSRHGDIIRFFAPDYKRKEVYAHIGGQTLGMAFDANNNLCVCVGGMGLYMVTPEREVIKLTDETNRSMMSIIDDSRLRLADDLDIAPDGRIFFSEATIRYEMHDWHTDALEGRGSGRIICYDPRTKKTRTVLNKLIFPNGICMTGDGQSFMFAETWGCTIKRYWFDGPRSGQVDLVIANLPGHPDNINRASDGNFWCGLIGMRSPVFDLVMRKPGFRTRMVKQLPVDEWFSPNLNTGCVIKFNAQGEVLESLWDMHGVNHPMITSMREHRGHLYLGGLSNNRIGRHKLEGVDPDYMQYHTSRKGALHV
jgi:ribose transport system permease protein